MPETILPGVTIEVRAEGLIVPLGVTVGNLGVVGTASKGPIGEPVPLGSYGEAQAVFGAYDPWNNGAAELTLVRALELAFNQGATTAIAVRVADANAAAAALTLSAGTDPVVKLKAASPGTWGNDIQVNVDKSTDNAFVEDEDVQGTPPKLHLAKVVPSARNRIRVKPAGGGLEQSFAIRYDKPANAGEVDIKPDGTLDFVPALGASDKVVASYMVAASEARKVTVRYQNTEEVYNVVSGDDLIRDVKASSALVTAEKGAKPDSLPDLSATADSFTRLAGGKNGATGANYQVGLDKLLDQNAHIIVAAGQDESFGDELAAHCKNASSDIIKRDRIAIVGSGDLKKVQSHTLASDRVVFVAPGITVADNAAVPPADVTLPGAYAAAAVAGLLASQDPHVSLTNKVLAVGGLEKIYNLPELRQLVQARVLALEKREGFRVVKGITTATDTAFAQITTRRIVDYTKFGVRSAANPFIGKLNNPRVRDALHASIASFLTDMIHSEMLQKYELSVSATREQEIRGIVEVNIVIQPTFSIDFIQVTIFLE